MRITRSSKKIKVENHPSLMRDARTTAIINNDSAAYERYMNEKNARLSQRDEIDRLKGEIELLKELILKQNK
tara:strand:- start:344 stop:559 length:216 start_codon:yes stop_codon:yes gene_type:complete